MLNGTHALCISIHDVAPATWSLCKRLRAEVRDVLPDARVTLLAVPNYHDGGSFAPTAYLEWLHACVAQGDEIALHGYTHRDEGARAARGVRGLTRRICTASEGEFAALTHADAVRRIARGRLWCAANGFRVRGFVAPAWMMGSGAWSALRDFDFEYTTTLTRFVALGMQQQHVVAPSVVYSTRSALRRTLSLGWNRALVSTTSSAPLLRVGLHPADVLYPPVMRHVRGLLQALISAREPMTKSAFAQRLRHRSLAGLPSSTTG